jgi:hypothetical protein
MTTRALHASASVMRRWLTLPYGLWVDATGREVLFNRAYQPIWQRVDGAVLAADSSEWIAWKSQRWFYKDADTSQHAALCRHLELILDAFRDGEDVSRWLITPRRFTA